MRFIRRLTALSHSIHSSSTLFMEPEAYYAISQRKLRVAARLERNVFYRKVLMVEGRMQGVVGMVDHPAFVESSRYRMPEWILPVLSDLLPSAGGPSNSDIDQVSTGISIDCASISHRMIDCVRSSTMA